MGNKEHAPSAYRKLIKGSKSGEVPINKLISEARALSEPYYVSLALYGLSMDKRLEKTKASKLRIDALNLVEKEQRPWRRAELIVSICKFGKDYLVSEEIIKLIEHIPESKAKAEAISGTVKYLGCENTSKFLQMSVANRGQEMESCKTVIKFWVQSCSDYEDILDILGKIKDIQVKIRLIGYLQLQLVRQKVQTSEPIEMAIELSNQLPGQEKLSVLKDLASQSEDIESLEAIVAAITTLETPIDEANLLTSLAGSADKAGQKDLALDWFNSAFECLNEVDDPVKSAGTRLNLAIGYQRLGQNDLAQQNFQLALDGAKDNEKFMSRIQKAMGHVVEKKFESIIEKKSKPVIAKSTRNILALHDTYEGNISPVHLRMIARAAPLCIAYGLDLALLDFPVQDLDDLVKRVSADTNVGKGGKYLNELVHENRILLITRPDEAGLAIATTSHPDKNKAISLEDARKKAKSHPQKRLCVIMGLGKKGLPKSLLDSVSHHSEITGSNVSLETSTAMGIIAQMMSKL